MTKKTDHTHRRERYEKETAALLHRRGKTCIWLGIVLFPMFSLLDYLVAPEHFRLFLMYRGFFSLSCIALFFIYSKPLFKRHTLSAILLWGMLASFVISLMVIQLGGFSSFYYVGIILVMMICTTVLPLTTKQAVVSTLLIYLTYAVPVYLFSELPGNAVNMFINNSFFFAGFMAIAVIQCNHDTRARKKEFDLKMELDLHATDLEEDFKNARIATILGLAKLAEYRDKDTGNHLERIREFSKVIARELSKMPKYASYITEDYIEDLYLSAILHDIGKVGIPDAILLKTDKLTPNEFEKIKLHTTYGGDILKMVESQVKGQSFVTLGKEIAYCHHEKWNGTGYPKGLKGEQIPLSTRLVALADVYDALTSKRSYKKALSHRQAIDIILKGKGKHFDPDVVNAFMRREKTFKTIRNQMPST